jgi:hypothetical protein
MSRFTGEDRLTAIVAQAMPALIPVDDIKRWKRVDRAIDDSGYIDPSSVQLLGNLLVAFLTEDTVVANASTTAYVTCIEANPELGNGTWTLNVHASASAFHSAGGNTDFRLNIEGVAYDVVTHTAPTAASAPFFTTAIVSGLDGGRAINVLAEFKCSSVAPATVNDATLQIIAVRTS